MAARDLVAVTSFAESAALERLERVHLNTRYENEAMLRLAQTLGFVVVPQG